MEVEKTSMYDKENTRTKNSVRNLISSIVAYLIQIVLNFLVRRYFIYVFNAEYLGINSLFSNVLSMLSLAELGFGTAITFAMYKPMATHDEQKIRQLLNFYKKCYYYIGIMVGIIGLAVIPFMDYFRAQVPNVRVNLYVVYFLFLTNTVCSYFFAYRRSLLYADQRTDIENKVNIFFNILSSVLQIAILLISKNYYLYIIITIITSILNNITIYIYTEKKYPEYISKVANPLEDVEKKIIYKNIKALALHRVGSVIVFSTDSLLIFVLIDSITLGKYSNYLMITTGVTAVINLIIGAIRGSVGNSIAKEDINVNQILFKKLNYLYMFVVSFCTICIVVLSNSFVKVVFSKDGTNILLENSIVFFLGISFFLTASRNMVSLFKECAGLFRQDRFKPIIEAAINLTSSILLSKYFGLIGIILGTIISTLIMPLWIEPLILNKYYLKLSTSKYFLRYFIYTVFMMVSMFVTGYVGSFIVCEGILSLIIKFVISAITALISLGLLYMVLPEFKQCVAWGKEIITNLKSRKLNKVEVGAVTNVEKVPCDNLEDKESAMNDQQATIEDNFGTIDDKNLNIQEQNTSENLNEDLNAKDIKNDEGKGN